METGVAAYVMPARWLRVAALWGGFESEFTYSMRQMSRAVKETVMTNNCPVSVGYVPSSKVLWVQSWRTFFLLQTNLPRPQFCIYIKAEDVLNFISPNYGKREIWSGIRLYTSSYCVSEKCCRGDETWRYISRRNGGDQEAGSEWRVPPRVRLHGMVGSLQDPCRPQSETEEMFI